ncbi:hypothetical protein AWB69_07279 [Caballeronia udeis]|uniref:Uncharacterized protein n=1 Tax=Caballeronia udeis TaxID=1232866 RepID=A0A158J727_9BURK|nr:hypothetical protein AWB69_07279 [Caballeronia udeis]
MYRDAQQPQPQPQLSPASLFRVVGVIFERGDNAVDHCRDARGMPKVLMHDEPDFIDRPACGFRPYLHEAVVFSELYRKLTDAGKSLSLRPPFGHSCDRFAPSTAVRPPMMARFDVSAMIGAGSSISTTGTSCLTGGPPCSLVRTHLCSWLAFTPSLRARPDSEAPDPDRLQPVVACPSGQSFACRRHRHAAHARAKS